MQQVVSVVQRRLPQDVSAHEHVQQVLLCADSQCELLLLICDWSCPTPQQCLQPLWQLRWPQVVQPLEPPLQQAQRVYSVEPLLVRDRREEQEKVQLLPCVAVAWRRPRHPQELRDGWVLLPRRPL